MRYIRNSCVCIVMAFMVIGCQSAAYKKDAASTRYRHKAPGYSPSSDYSPSEGRMPSTTRSGDNIPPDISHLNQAYRVPKDSGQKRKAKEKHPSTLPPDSMMAKQYKAQQSQQQKHQNSQGIWQRTSAKPQSGNQKQKQTKQKLELKESGQTTYLNLPGKDNAKTLQSVKQAADDANYRILRVDKHQGDIFLLDTSSSKGKIDEATPLYRLHLSDEQNGAAQLKIYNEANQQLQTQTAKPLLSSIAKQLRQSQ